MSSDDIIAVYTLELFDQYVHVVSLSMVSILMVISAYQVCISSINDQPKIKYRFTTMLYCFVHFITTLMALSYFFINPLDPRKTAWLYSIALLMRLSIMLSRVLGVLCAYSLLLTIVRKLYRTPQYKRPIPHWFKVFTKLFCALIMFIDIAQTIIAFLTNNALFQNLFLLILIFWCSLFSIVVVIALLGARKQTQYLLNRVDAPYKNSVVSPLRNEGVYNPSSSQFNLANINLPKTVNLMDVDGKSMRSQMSNNEPYKILQNQMLKIKLSIVLGVITLCLCCAAAVAMFRARHIVFEPLTFAADAGDDDLLMTELPFMGKMYLVTSVFNIIYITCLLWWLYIPKSFCCDNIARDSAFYACCRGTLNCCMQPSEVVVEHHSDGENSVDFDFFNVGTWHKTFQLASYRQMELMHGMNEPQMNADGDEEYPIADESVTFDSNGDMDYNDIATNRSHNVDMSALLSEDNHKMFQRKKFSKLYDESPDDLQQMSGFSIESGRQ